MDKFACPDDQCTNAGSDQSAAHHHQRRGEPAHRKRRSRHPGNPTPGQEGRECHGVGGQAANIVEQAPNGDTERSGATGHGRHGIRDGFERRGGSDRQLVR